LEEYMNLILNGGWKLNINPGVERLTGNTALIDGNDGLGIVTAHKAMDLAINLAEQNHVGVVSVKRGGHFGMAAYYSMMALEKDMIGIVMTNASPGISPWGGTPHCWLQRIGSCDYGCDDCRCSKWCSRGK
jgi:L-2-hydroxycarboxylate dehydrogenase (NAD+)